MTAPSPFGQPSPPVPPVPWRLRIIIAVVAVAGVLAFLASLAAVYQDRATSAKLEAVQADLVATTTRLCSYVQETRNVLRDFVRFSGSQEFTLPPGAPPALVDLLAQADARQAEFRRYAADRDRKSVV